MKHRKKMTAAMLAALLMINTMPMSAFAAEANTTKEEVVYINLNADGSVKEINVVNIFDLDENGKIIDYGNYESLRNMTTTDAINYEENKVTIDAQAGKLYYEGKLKENAMPWTISIKYYMDGEECSADQVAGRSGKLQIKMTIRQNKNCNSSFFEGYALQTTFVLDTKQASNIVAEGATVANVGSDKQLTYTILPNNEKDMTVSADVKDFEMAGISINGIRMNLDIDIDDSTLREKEDKIVDAVNELDDGAGKLKDGASDLHNATEELNTAVGTLYTGVGNLYNGAAQLNSGLSALTSKNGELVNGAKSAYEGLCSGAETQLNAQLSANGLNTVKLTPENYSDVLLGVLEQMDADAVYKKAYDAALEEVTAQVKAQQDELYTGYIRSQADTIYQQYVESQADALYAQAASKAVVKQLMANGYSQEQAVAYLQTEEGKALVASAVEGLTEEQKEQIIATALQSLTEEQKEQILKGAVDSLTKEQKKEILEGYIEQMMASDEVTDKINEAVNAVSSAAAEVSALKGQLDSFGAFYKGVVDYTSGVSSVANGANQLAGGLSTLYTNTDTLKNGVGELHSAVGSLKDGTRELKDGTGEFVGETSDMDTQITDEIDSMKTSITGEKVETVSFVSEQNTNVKAVQFVMQSEGIQVPEEEDAQEEETETLNFWQKLFALFE